MFLYLALIQIERILFLVSWNIILFFKLVLRLLFHCKVLLNMFTCVRFWKIQELSIANNLLALAIILEWHFHVALNVISRILVSYRCEFGLMVLLLTHPHHLRLTLGHSRAQVLLVVLVKARVIACMLFIRLTLLRFLFKLLLQLGNYLVFNLDHLLLLLLILPQTNKVLFFFLILSLHFWDFFFEHYLDFMETFNLSLLRKTAPAVKITRHIGAERIELTFHILKLRFQNPILSLNLLHLFIILRIFEFDVLNFSLNGWHFFYKLPLFVQFFFCFDQLLISKIELLFQNLIFVS